MILIVFLLIPAAFSTSAAIFDQSHQQFDRVLKEYVKEGLVNYSGLQKNPKELREYIDDIGALRPEEFNQWTEAQQLALLINLYNAATLDLIRRHYPISSIKKIGSFLKGPWDQPVVPLFGKTVTLNHLEHEIIRKKYSEPQIHFAIVCAAMGCPPLRSEAYIAARLPEQLANQGRRFLNTPSKNRADVEKRLLYLSPIFRWFADDFEKKAGSVPKFVAPYFPPAVEAEVKKGGFKVRFTEYDWSLNEMSKAP